jgi:hypothetical protein
MLKRIPERCVQWEKIRQRAHDNAPARRGELPRSLLARFALLRWDAGLLVDLLCLTTTYVVLSGNNARNLPCLRYAICAMYYKVERGRLDRSTLSRDPHLHSFLDPARGAAAGKRLTAGVDGVAQRGHRCAAGRPGVGPTSACGTGTERGRVSPCCTRRPSRPVARISPPANLANPARAYGASPRRSTGGEDATRVARRGACWSARWHPRAPAGSHVEFLELHLDSSLSGR